MEQLSEWCCSGIHTMKNIAYIGQIVFIIGLILSVVGLIFGFWFLIIENNDKWAMRFLLLVPAGFMLLFTGLATSVMFSPHDDSELNKHRSLQDSDD